MEIAISHYRVFSLFRQSVKIFLVIQCVQCSAVQCSVVQCSVVWCGRFSAKNSVVQCGPPTLHYTHYSQPWGRQLISACRNYICGLYDRQSLDSPLLFLDLLRITRLIRRFVSLIERGPLILIFRLIFLTLRYSLLYNIRCILSSCQALNSAWIKLPLKI